MIDNLVSGAGAATRMPIWGTAHAAAPAAAAKRRVAAATEASVDRGYRTTS
ncbi:MULTISPECIES: hypothetical protein [Mycobacterium]|uniref:hypothetical protein n=1 Tax=Mycobacterium TaxID=1763 RepID=UPI001EF10596|nr:MULTISPECIES: hypothetical protein [Mycobacterium]BDB40966.1 hypothetical protein IWGMT90018_14120 [Mycobacterium kiyosense]BDE12762.1 hypothetical protein MKCMC460_16220 [Mycobacterium sp. 20KCMC460]GLB87791.1 hypothetical protein SRL2020130_06080 [Mycobacterium kiyosense]GLC00676.1 hypothetical protein SRL2020400_12670 [Mycobacterium kiyosense]GLC06763.1 hypothetical protein SRL2020411_14090 [Mycobacterium kiyosense]